MIIKTDKAKRKQLSLRQRRHMRRIRQDARRVAVPDNEIKNRMRTLGADKE
jgi:hypothetical protein